MAIRLSLLLVAVGFLLAGCGDGSSKFLEACEKEIQNRLSYASTYERIDITFLDLEQISIEEHFARTLFSPDGGFSAEDLAFIETAEMLERQYYKHSVIIQYDADNAYGTPTRLAAMCDYSHYEQEFSRDHYFFPMNMRINDKTFLEWISSR